eukprot:2332470-Prymnesium_polylepis.2
MGHRAFLRAGCSIEKPTRIHSKQTRVFGAAAPLGGASGGSTSRGPNPYAVLDGAVPRGLSPRQGVDDRVGVAP